jgi:hypothetical protein
MKTFFTILILILIYVAVSRLIGIVILNIIGLPGAIIGRKSISKREPKYILGIIISAIGHVYVYLSFMIYIITWTRLRVDICGFSKYLVWFFCMVASVGSIQQIYYNAKKEATEFPNGYENPQILSLLITEVVSFFSFILFVFYPDTINPMWTWVLKINYPI